ncbi:hypothetical protein PAECIP111891_03182 [Paenibacillus allorhizoplanae]|uniref:PASTA domain-containing protein n=1 Tax=Paenibacillus allorhizoplanae TaxID=2905648 RepID=A0ABM9CAC8_9BACL|nr:PASTA domain-containing protein [Paenibacillus allorhizoplanae]CAH1208246.1 hypothetical protein PAECIP111891_03182 [Paenibacillus allorhizoplanae]
METTVILKQILNEHGIAVCSDKRRLYAMLMDLCPGKRTELKVLMAAIEEKVVQDLLNISEEIVDLAQYNRFVHRLVSDAAIEKTFAENAVESWILAIGKKMPVMLAPLAPEAQVSDQVHGKKATPAISLTPSAGTSNSSRRFTSLSTQKIWLVIVACVVGLGIIGYIAQTTGNKSPSMVADSLKALDPPSSSPDAMFADSPMKVTVSVPKEKMPNLIGLKIKDARETLRVLGIDPDKHIQIEQQFSDEVTVDTVIQQLPRVDEQVYPSTLTVQLSVSKGKETFKMPNLIGLSLTDAKKAISDNRLKLAPENISYESSYNFQKDKVITQFPYGAENEVSPGSEIKLIVSKGMPDDAGVMTVPVTLVPIIDGKDSTFKITVSDATGENINYKTVQTSKQQTVSVNVTVSPDKSAIIQIYEHSQLVSIQKRTYQDYVSRKNGGSTQSTSGVKGGANSGAVDNAEDKANIEKEKSSSVTNAITKQLMDNKIIIGGEKQYFSYTDPYLVLQSNIDFLTGDNTQSLDILFKVTSKTDAAVIKITFYNKPREAPAQFLFDTIDVKSYASGDLTLEQMINKVNVAVNYFPVKDIKPSIH